MLIINHHYPPKFRKKKTLIFVCCFLISHRLQRWDLSVHWSIRESHEKHSGLLFLSELPSLLLHRRSLPHFKTHHPLFQIAAAAGTWFLRLLLLIFNSSSLLPVSDPTRVTKRLHKKETIHYQIGSDQKQSDGVRFHCSDLWTGGATTPKRGFACTTMSASLLLVTTTSLVLFDHIFTSSFRDLNQRDQYTERSAFNNGIINIDPITHLIAVI